MALQYITDYKSNPKWRKSFCELAQDVFGLQFEDWYEKGFWGEGYIPCSYLDGEKVVANVSVNKLDILAQGRRYRGIQIGTVMTHPAYRNQGLAGSLMKKVLDTYEGQYDFMYLFANETVLNFYPKFGFTETDEYIFSMDFCGEQRKQGNIRKLAVTNKEELQFITDYVSVRIPVSRTFAIEGAGSITMYHCLYTFADNIYYVKGVDAIVIFEKNNNELHLFDIISKKAVDVQQLLANIADEDIQQIIFHYTPDHEGMKIEKKLMKRRDGAFFVKNNSTDTFPQYVKHPTTAEA